MSGPIEVCPECGQDTILAVDETDEDYGHCTACQRSWGDGDTRRMKTTNKEDDNE